MNLKPELLSTMNALGVTAEELETLQSLLQNRGLGRSKMISLPTLCVDETKGA